jgi:hypothetical protein
VVTTAISVVNAVPRSYKFGRSKVHPLHVGQAALIGTANMARISKFCAVISIMAVLAISANSAAACARPKTITIDCIGNGCIGVEIITVPSHGPLPPRMKRTIEKIKSGQLKGSVSC